MMLACKLAQPVEMLLGRLVPKRPQKGRQYFTFPQQRLQHKNVKNYPPDLQSTWSPISGLRLLARRHRPFKTSHARYKPCMHLALACPIQDRAFIATPLRREHLTPHHPPALSAILKYKVGVSKLFLLSIYELNLDPHHPMQSGEPGRPCKSHSRVRVQVEPEQTCPGHPQQGLCNTKGEVLSL